MSKFDPEIIRKIVKSGDAAELHRMLLGISRYIVPGKSSQQPISEEDALLGTLATHHLEFISRHGLGVAEARHPKGYVETAHEREFEEWLRRGAPGLYWEDVLAYLNDHPAR